MITKSFYCTCFVLALTARYQTSETFQSMFVRARGFQGEMSGSDAAEAEVFMKVI
jgi:hypothetical protein